MRLIRAGKRRKEKQKIQKKKAAEAAFFNHGK
jgi:hypothetical protein